MKRLLLLLFLSTRLFAQPVTVTGTITDSGGNLATSGTVEFDIAPFSSSIQYYVPGQTSIAPQSVICSISTVGTLVSSSGSGPCTVWGNDVIAPANTTYTVVFSPNGLLNNSVPREYIAGTLYNLNSPVFAPAVSIIPQYSSIVAPVIQGNLIPALNGSFTVGNAQAFYSNAFFNNLTFPSSWNGCVTVVNGQAGFGSCSGGGGPYLPLSAGASFPLTNPLYLAIGTPTGQQAVSAAALGSFLSSYCAISGCAFTGGITGTSASFITTNGVVNPTQPSSSVEIGAAVNAAIAACPKNGNSNTPSCTIDVPQGIYSQTSTIVVPAHTYSALRLHFDAGALLFYTGSADAIQTTPGQSPAGNLTIEGGQLWGSSAGSGANGVHLYPTNGVTIRDMQITQFTTGDGIRVEGANQVNIYNNFVQGNKNGVDLIPTFCSGSTCGPTVSGTQYTANAVHVTDNDITGNSNWAILDQTNGITGGTTGTLGNSYCDNDLEVNGGAGSTFGAVWLYKTVGSTVCRDYFEGSPREVVLGPVSGGGSYFIATGTKILDNYFTLSTFVPFEIELQNATGTIIDGNSTVDSSNGHLLSGNCFVNITTEDNTTLGVNQVALSGGASLLCQGGMAIGAFPGLTSYPVVNSNYVTQIVDGNFQTQGTSPNVVTIGPRVTPLSYCFGTPYSSSDAASTNPIVVTPGNGNVSVYFPTAGLRYNLWCASY